MSEHGDKQPAELPRTRRLEIVADEDKVRAALGTNEEGVTGLSVFDQSGRLRASLDAGEISDQGSGLSVFDTNGKPRAVVSVDNDPDKGCGLTLLDTDGKQRILVSLHTGSEAGLRFSSGQKNRGIQMAASDDGSLYLLLRAHFKTPVWVSEADEHGARMKGTNVEYRRLYTYTASVTPGFEMRSK